MSTSFIRQQIEMGIHGIMSQVFQQLVDIGKPLVHNEVQQAKELEARSADFCAIQSPILHKEYNCNSSLILYFHLQFHIRNIVTIIKPQNLCH